MKSSVVLRLGITLLSGWCLLGLGACGQKGPLVMPTAPGAASAPSR